VAGSGEWQTEYRPSWLALKQQGPNKAVVVRIAPDAVLGMGKARLYEGWVNGRKIYDPADEFRVGQVVRLD
jgi:hypothetical protein